jgi:hypothetical protein
LIATNQPLAEIASNPLFLSLPVYNFNSCEYLKPDFIRGNFKSAADNAKRQTKCCQVLIINHYLFLKQDLLSLLAIIVSDRHGYVWQNNVSWNDLQSYLLESSHLGIPYNV